VALARTAGGPSSAFPSFSLYGICLDFVKFPCAFHILRRQKKIMALVLAFSCSLLQDKWSCVSFITFIMIKDTSQSIKNLSCGVLSIRNPTFQFATSEAQIAVPECVAGILRYLTKF
jgi:hypothetical protein